MYVCTSRGAYVRCTTCLFRSSLRWSVATHILTLEQKHGLVERRTSRSSRNASRDFEGSMAKRLGSTTIDELSAESPVRVEGKQVETLVQPMSPH